MTSTKKVLIIAGPNGAGKTTFAREILPNEADCPVFMNADLIAAGLPPSRPPPGRLLAMVRQRRRSATTIRGGEAPMSNPETAIPVSHLPDPDMQAVPAALVRAARRARELAARTGTPLIINQDGRVVECPPSDLGPEDTGSSPTSQG
jgi:hypothetical protein